MQDVAVVAAAAVVVEVDAVVDGLDFLLEFGEQCLVNGGLGYEPRVPWELQSQKVNLGRDVETFNHEGK